MVTPGFRRKPSASLSYDRKRSKEEHSEEELYVMRHEVHECVEKRRLRNEHIEGNSRKNGQ